MSALPPKADMCGALANVGYGPIADIEQYLVRLASKRWPYVGVSLRAPKQSTGNIIGYFDPGDLRFRPDVPANREPRRIIESASIQPPLIWPSFSSHANIDSAALAKI